MSIGNIKYRYSLVKRIIYSIISFIKVLTPLMALEGEVGKMAERIEPIFLNTFNFLNEHFNIFLQFSDRYAIMRSEISGGIT